MNSGFPPANWVALLLVAASAIVAQEADNPAFAYRARRQWQNHDIAVSGWLHGPELGVTFKF